MKSPLLFSIAAAAAIGAANSDIESARDRQDRPALEKAAAGLAGAAERNPNDAEAHYRAAAARSYLAEVALELRDRNQARAAAEAGIKAAEQAVTLAPNKGEYHRILGTLCGQVIPANVLAGLKYGKCARDEVNKAVELDPKSALAYVSRGVGNYYLPAAMGGGVELAIKDFRKAVELNPKLAEAHLWLGIALRKAGQNAEARETFQRSIKLNPARIWAKTQLDKTPAN